MMKNYHQSVEIIHHLNWLYIPDHPYKIFIIGGSGSGKTILLLNLIKNQQPDIDKIYLYIKDPFELNYQLLINGREKVGSENLKNPKAFIGYSQTAVDVHENLKDYNPAKKRRYDDMADMESNKKLSPIVIKLLIRGRKLNISFAFTR